MARYTVLIDRVELIPNKIFFLNCPDFKATYQDFRPKCQPRANGR